MPDTFKIEFEFRGTRYTDAEEGLKAFARATGMDGTFVSRAVPALTARLRWYLEQVAEAMAKRHGVKWPGGTSSKTLSRRSGALITAIKDSIKVTSGNTLESVRGEIGGDVVYARIQEFGGTITPKTAKYLAIPLPAALNSDGTPIKLSPRAWDMTFVAKSKAGNLIIFRRQGKSVIPLYVLKSKVYIPPRLGLGDTLRTGLNYFVDKALTDMLNAVKAP